jgi:hypothetical protein
MVELEWISAGSQLNRHDPAGRALGWLEIIPLEWISAGWTQSIQGWLERVELGWLTTGWTRSSRAGTRLAGDNQARMNLGWLDEIDLGLAGDGRAGMALDWIVAIEPSWLLAGWR